MEGKKDCFAYRVRNYCGVLVEMVCKRRSCSFYKSKQQFNEDAQRAREIVERKMNNVK